MTRAWFDGAQGSGIPQAIAARRSADAEHRSMLMSTRVTIGKIVLTVLGLLVGASTGREGPTVQVGAAIMFGIGRFAGIGRQPGLILAGAAAGVAATWLVIRPLGIAGLVWRTGMPVHAAFVLDLRFWPGDLAKCLLAAAVAAAALRAFPDLLRDRR